MWDLPFEEDEAIGDGSAVTKQFDQKRARLFKHYFQGFRILWRKILRRDAFSKVHYDKADEVSFDGLGDDGDIIDEVAFKKGRTPSESEIDRVANMPFWALAKQLLFLRFNPEYAGDMQCEGITAKTIFYLAIAAGAVEIGFFGAGKFFSLLGDAIDHALFKSIALAGRRVVSFFVRSVEYDPNFYRNRNTWLGSLVKAGLSSFVMPVHAIWHFAVSKPLSVVAYSRSKASKFLYLLGLLAIIGIAIGMSFGLAAVPVIGAALSHLAFIPIVGDIVATVMSSILAPVTTVVIAEAIGLYFSWVAMMAIGKSVASVFLKLISFGPIVKEDLEARSHNIKLQKLKQKAIDEARVSVSTPAVLKKELELDLTKKNKTLDDFSCQLSFSSDEDSEASSCLSSTASTVVETESLYDGWSEDDLSDTSCVLPGTSMLDIPGVKKNYFTAPDSDSSDVGQARLGN